MSYPAYVADRVSVAFPQMQTAESRAGSAAKINGEIPYG